MMSGLLVAFLVAILLVGGAILFMVSYGRRGEKQLDVEKYRHSWIKIERQLQKDQEATYHLTILNADKLLDQALRHGGYRGDTMGERMRSAKGRWSNANNIWSAHKLRNQIAHESDVKVSYDNARRALASFKQALKDIGAI